MTQSEYYKSYTGFLNSDVEKIRTKLRGSNGVQLTEALFEETCTSAKSKDPNFQALYSLKEYPTTNTPSAYQIYIHSVDETEAAMKLVGSLSHWRKLCSLKWFLTGRKDVGFEGLLQWRQDMWERDRSAAKKVLIKLASEGNVTAARTLDKLASDELIRLNKISLPSNKPVSVDNDGLDFLDHLGM